MSISKNEISMIEGLNIPQTRTITKLRIANAKSVLRNASGYSWSGRITLLDEFDGIISDSGFMRVIAENSDITYEALNAQAQTDYNMDYVSITVEQSRTVFGTVMATQLITALASANIGISIEDVQSLVMQIVMIAR